MAGELATCLWKLALHDLDNNGAIDRHEFHNVVIDYIRSENAYCCSAADDGDTVKDWKLIWETSVCFCREYGGEDCCLSSSTDGLIYYRPQTQDAAYPLAYSIKVCEYLPLAIQALVVDCKCPARNIGGGEGVMKNTPRPTPLPTSDGTRESPTIPLQNETRTASPLQIDDRTAGPSNLRPGMPVQIETRTPSPSISLQIIDRTPSPSLPLPIERPTDMPLPSEAHTTTNPNLNINSRTASPSMLQGTNRGFTTSPTQLPDARTASPSRARNVKGFTARPSKPPLQTESLTAMPSMPLQPITSPPSMLTNEGNVALNNPWIAVGVAGTAVLAFLLSLAILFCRFRALGRR